MGRGLHGTPDYLRAIQLDAGSAERCRPEPEKRDADLCTVPARWCPRGAERCADGSLQCKLRDCGVLRALRYHPLLYWSDCGKRSLACANRTRVRCADEHRTSVHECSCGWLLSD